jgi:hypothetical protein
MVAYPESEGGLDLYFDNTYYQSLSVGILEFYDTGVPL